MIAVEDYEEQVAYLTRLCKSANPATREQATERLTFLTQLIAADLEKVGPKGYIHGWIKVGPGFTGEHVHHPEHGRGIVTRVGSKTTGVQFENGHYGAFEHTQRAPEHGSAHFAERVPARKPAAPKPPARQKPAGTPAGSFAQIRDRHAEATTKPPTMDDHLGRAHAALTEGRHADAVNHLTAAANAAPDKASRDRITAARNELGARLMGKPPKAPGRAAKPKTPKTPKAPKLSPEDTVARLRAAKSGDEVQQIIAGHTKPELKAALDHAGVSYRTGGDKAHMWDQLTRWAEGQRPKPEVASRRAPSAPRPGAAGADLHQIRRDAGIETPLLGSPDAANRAAHMLQSGASHKDVAAFLRDAAAAEERNQLEMHGEDTPEINQSRTRQRYLGRLADAVERAGPGSNSSSAGFTAAAQAKPAHPHIGRHGGLTPLTGRDALDAAPVDARHGSRNGAPLTATARKALDEYLGDGQRINDQIRRGALTTRTKTTVRQVDKVMAESPLRSDVEVWRGIGTGRPIFGDAMNKDLTGFDWTEKAFVSTTADRRVAEEFAGMLPAKEPVVVMRVVAPKGTGAVALSHFGDGAAMGDQAELLLDRDLPFRVVADHGVVGHPRIPAGVRMLDVTVAEKRPHTAAHSGAAPGLPDHAPAKKTAKAATRLVGTLNDLTFEANTETPTEPRERA